MISSSWVNPMFVTDYLHSIQSFVVNVSHNVSCFSGNRTLCIKPERQVYLCVNFSRLNEALFLITKPSCVYSCCKRTGEANTAKLSSYRVIVPYGSTDLSQDCPRR